MSSKWRESKIIMVIHPIEETDIIFKILIDIFVNGAFFSL